MMRGQGISRSRIPTHPYTWIVDKPLKDTYPSLYHIERGKHVTVSKVLSSRPLNISFGWSLVGINLSHWIHLVARISNVVLVDDKTISSRG
jgi:hypothetical protein